MKGICEACHHEQEIPQGNTPMPSGLASAMWRCVECGSQLVVTFDITIGQQSGKPELDADAIGILIDSAQRVERNRVELAVKKLHDATLPNTSYGKGQRVAYRRVLNIITKPSRDQREAI
jgi:hypothetical protein